MFIIEFLIVNFQTYNKKKPIPKAGNGDCLVFMDFTVYDAKSSYFFYTIQDFLSFLLHSLYITL